MRVSACVCVLSAFFCFACVYTLAIKMLKLHKSQVNMERSPSHAIKLGARCAAAAAFAFAAVFVALLPLLVAFLSGQQT